MKDYKLQLERTKLRAEKREAKIRDRLEMAKLHHKEKIVKMKQKSLKRLRDELQTITNRIVRTMSNACYTCQKILEFKDRQAGHHFSRGAHSAARYEFDNLRVQCSGCNMYKSGEQAEFAYFLRKELGDQRYEDLYKLAHSVKKWSREELVELIEKRKVVAPGKY